MYIIFIFTHGQIFINRPCEARDKYFKYEYDHIYICMYVYIICTYTHDEIQSNIYIWTLRSTSYIFHM